MSSIAGTRSRMRLSRWLCHIAPRGHGPPGAAGRAWRRSRPRHGVPVGAAVHPTVRRGRPSDISVLMNVDSICRSRSGLAWASCSSTKRAGSILLGAVIASVSSSMSGNSVRRITRWPSYTSAPRPSPGRSHTTLADATEPGSPARQAQVAAQMVDSGGVRIARRGFSVDRGAVPRSSQDGMRCRSARTAPAPGRPSERRRCRW
jgi:hypothetical protein